MNTGIEVGMVGRASLVVGDTDTAIAMGSGSVPVLATPRVVALCEAATCAAVDAALADGTTTVGVRVELDHLRATPVGGFVEAEATVLSVEGRQITFAVRASEGSDGNEVATGLVRRVIVDRSRFPG